MSNLYRIVYCGHAIVEKGIYLKRRDNPLSHFDLFLFLNNNNLFSAPSGMLVSVHVYRTVYLSCLFGELSLSANAGYDIGNIAQNSLECLETYNILMYWFSFIGRLVES